MVSFSIVISKFCRHFVQYRLVNLRARINDVFSFCNDKLECGFAWGDSHSVTIRKEREKGS